MFSKLVCSFNKFVTSVAEIGRWTPSLMISKANPMMEIIFSLFQVPAQNGGKPCPKRRRSMVKKKKCFNLPPCSYYWI